MFVGPARMFPRPPLWLSTGLLTLFDAYVSGISLISLQSTFETLSI